MILTYNSEDFTLDTGVYYSPAFKIETEDQLITIECLLDSNGSVGIQHSLDSINWYDSINNDFLCSPAGLQSYVECQPNLVYRLKSTIEFTSAKILL
jgi:hypothetical protein